MFAFALFFYFVLMVAAAAIFFLPAARARAMAAASGAWRSFTDSWRRARHGAAQTSAASVRAAGHAGSGAMQFLVRRRLMLLGVLAVVAVPVLLSVVLRSGKTVFYEDAARDTDEKVEALLRGEQLVPPQALPPEVFATAEVEQVRPLTREGSRNWDVLDPDFRARLLLVYKVMKDKHGYDLALLEGYRSPERQAKLAALGEHVTRAKANQSYHQYGLAADNAFYRNGKLVISEKDAWAMEGYRLYGEVAESLGLVWGGRWSFKDYGHVEYRRPGFKLPRD
ncbi:M15 family metallopeptidase [Variovorax sp. dw_308]|uniref:M15 family metallopeptidase n=1 Tax=Variovorax sp. dw_308 TaxID=2721546 RepID=UPI001C468E65|nr:M15 family metallopeptidase [Variovorax sp. dw_308]